MPIPYMRLFLALLLLPALAGPARAVDGFRAAHGLTAAAYQRWFDQAAADGLRVIYVNGYDVGGEPRCKGARVGETVVITVGKRGADLPRRLFADVWKDVIAAKCIAQLRDNIAGIFFPASWGCFGGGMEPGETTVEALVRELKEELDLTVAPAELRYFTRFDFDLAFAGLTSILRDTFELKLEPSRLVGLRVLEGAAMKLFTADELLTGASTLTPYDAFALWLHINKGRLIG